MDAESFRTTEAERIIGMPIGSLKSLARRGFGRPDKGDRWSRHQVAAMAVMRAARRQGASLVAAVAAYDLLARISPEELAATIAAGRQFLVLLGETIILRPVGRDRAFGADLLEKSIRDHLPLVVVDLHYWPKMDRCS